MQKGGNLSFSFLNLSPRSKGVILLSPQHIEHGDNKSAEQMIWSGFSFIRQISAWHKLLSARSVSLQRSLLCPPLPQQQRWTCGKQRSYLLTWLSHLVFPFLYKKRKENALLNHSDIASFNLRYQATLLGKIRIGNKSDNIHCDNAWENVSVCTKVLTDCANLHIWSV